METSDENLALAAAGGDANAFSVLIARHYDRLFGLCFRLTGHRADAEDLTHDIATALPGKLGGFRGEARFTTWLYRVAVNAAHDRRRRHASHSKAARGWGDWEVSRQAEIAQDRDACDWLKEVMQGLPDDLRDTLALTLEDGLTHAQAGQILNVSEGTISWRMAEVKKHLRALHEKEAEA